MLKLSGILLRNQAISFISPSIKQNNRYLQISKGLSQRRASSSVTGSSVPTKREKQITPLGWFLMLVPVTTFGLGCWQLKRKAWKERLIEDLEKLTQTSPVELPEDLSKLNDMEYRLVKVRGTFLHDKELLLGPRSFIKSDGGVGTAGSLFSKRDAGSGYWVITPFKLVGRDDVILINRGWIPRKNIKIESRLAGQITDEIELICVVRKEEQRPQFTPEHKGGVFLYRDLQKMCTLTGAQPVFLDATYGSSVPGGPIGGQTRINLPNDHLSYLITWYSLSLVTGYLWYRTIFRGKHF